MLHCNILEMKLENYKIMEPEIVVLEQGLNCNS